MSQVNKEQNMKDIVKKFVELKNDVEGKVAVPILMYILGVPGFIVLFVWLFFFRNR